DHAVGRGGSAPLRRLARRIGPVATMQRFSCPSCGNEVHFDSPACLGCNREIGFAPHSGILLVDASGQAAVCANRQQIGCNWLVEDGDASGFCASCRLTTTIPDLSVDGNIARWARL